MREIRLNSVQYKLTSGSEVIKRQLNPFKGKLGKTGGLEFDDFGQASVEEYHDFRGGIGLESDLADESNRLHWSEGVDVSSPRSAVLGPLVTTAGSFGVAPVKILDFQSVTYAIADNAFRKWNATTSNWDYADPYLIHDCEAAWDELVDGDATVTLDTAVEKQGSGCAKMVVGAGLANGDIIATDNITSLDLSSAEKVVLWIQCTETRASGDLQLLLDDSINCASPVETINIPALVANTWTQVTLTLANPGSDTAIISVGIKFTSNAEACTIYVDHIRGTFPDAIDTLVVQDDTDEYMIVSSSSAAIYSADGTTWSPFTSAPGGYMASFAGRLWFISTDGKTVTYSAYNKILTFDPAWTTPTGDYDPDATWTAEEQAYDGDVDSNATDANIPATSWGGYVELTFTEGWFDRVRVYATYTSTEVNQVDIDVYYSNAWYNLYEGGFVDETWETFKLGSSQKISRVRIRGYNTNAAAKTFTLGEINIGKGSDDFILVGDFGTVYGLFEGKLMSDGSPALYFHGTRGLFAIDVSAEVAYQQEVSYPPLTNAGRAGLYWNANLWVSTGYGILKIAPSTATHIGPDQDDGLPSGFQGSIYEIETVNNWLVYCVNGGSTDKSSILKRNATLGGNLQVYTTSATNKAIPCLHHSPSSQFTNGRLWWGEDTDIKYAMFPDVTHNVKQIATYEYGDTSLLENGSFEAGDPPASWTLIGGSATVSRSSAQAKIGTYSALLTRNGVDCHIYQGYSGYAGYASKTVTLGCWVYATVAARAGIGLGDGKDSASSTLHTGVAGWEWLTVSLTVDATPTYLRSYLEIVDGNTSAYFDGATLIDNETNAKLPIFRKLAVISKTALGVALITEDCDDNEFITVYYGLNGAAPTTLLGTYKTSPRPTILTFGSGLGTVFYRIQLAVKLIRGSTNTNTPQLESLIFYYIPTPVTIHSWTFQIEATGDEGERWFTEFEAIRDTNTLVPFIPSGDSAKTSYNIKLAHMPSREWWENQGRREGVFTVTVQQLFEG